MVAFIITVLIASTTVVLIRNYFTELIKALVVGFWINLVSQNSSSSFCPEGRCTGMILRWLVPSLDDETFRKYLELAHHLLFIWTDTAENRCSSSYFRLLLHGPCCSFQPLGWTNVLWTFSGQATSRRCCSSATLSLWTQCDRSSFDTNYQLTTEWGNLSFEFLNV